MSKYSSFKGRISAIYKSLLFGTSIYAGACFYQGYLNSIAPSEFHRAITNLGFDTRVIKTGTNYTEITVEQQEEALLRVLFMAGYLKPANLWKDINKFGNFAHPEIIFQAIYPVLIAAGADQEDINKFNPKILRKNLFKIDEVGNDHVMDFITYLAQHAFNRVHGQERNELKSIDWMVAYKDYYIENAKVLGLIDRISPSGTTYDEAWIAGASRIGVMTRVIDYFELPVEAKTVKVLAGARPLWAEIDGISPELKSKLMKLYSEKSDIDNLDTLLLVGDAEERTKEGIEYILALAQKYDILLDKNSPVIIYPKDACPKGLFPGRHYANYAAGEERRLTESLMSKDVLSLIARDSDISIVDTEFAGTRPTTATTAKDAIMAFMERVLSGEFGGQKEFHIIQQSNQPYIERQAIVAQVEVNKFLHEAGLDSKGYKVVIEGIGFSNKQDVPVIHSEFGALLGAKWRLAVMDSRPSDHIMYQIRDKAEYTGPMPDPIDYNTDDIFTKLSGLAQAMWDEILE